MTIAFSRQLSLIDSHVPGAAAGQGPVQIQSFQLSACDRVKWELGDLTLRPVALTAMCPEQPLVKAQFKFEAFSYPHVIA